MKFAKIGFGLMVVGGLTAGVAVYNMSNDTKVSSIETKSKPNISQTVEKNNDKKEVKEVLNESEDKKDIKEKSEVKHETTGATAKKTNKEVNISKKEVKNKEIKKEELIVNKEPEKVVNDNKEPVQKEEINTEELECMYCKLL